MEFLRRGLRSVLGATRFYRWGSRAAEEGAVLLSEGPRTWRDLSRLRSSDPGIGVTTELRLRRLTFPFSVRSGPEDVTTLVNTVVREEWGQLPAWLAAPEWMLDAGAYIGDTAAYFLSRFPGLTAVCLEPDGPNHAIARKNLEPYGERAILLNAALWSADGELGMSGSLTRARLNPAGRGITTVSVPGLARRFGIPRFDIVKMDIEGAEAEVLSTNVDSWLPTVRTLILEVHGAAATEAVRETMSRFDFSVRRFRSVWYCFNEASG